MAQRELVNKEVSNIFQAIFARIKMDDMKHIDAAVLDSRYACANLGNSSQLEAQKKLDLMMDMAVQNITDHDMNTILKVLKESELFNKVLDENI